MLVSFKSDLKTRDLSPIEHSYTLFRKDECSFDVIMSPPILQDDVILACILAKGPTLFVIKTALNVRFDNDDFFAFSFLCINCKNVCKCLRSSYRHITLHHTMQLLCRINKNNLN